MGDNFLSVEIGIESITSLNNNMKPPKLPGTEKFKFNDRKGTQSRSTCPSMPPISISTTQPSFNRFDSRRKPILPITSHMTSRVLTLTHLPLDSFDIRDLHSCHKSVNLRNSYVNSSKNECDSRAPTNTSTSRVSLFSDCSGSHCSSSQPSPRSLGSPLDRSLTPSHWAKNAHRLSTSSQSSWEDLPDNCHESAWTSTK